MESTDINSPNYFDDRSSLNKENNYVQYEIISDQILINTSDNIIVKDVS